MRCFLIYFFAVIIVVIGCAWVWVIKRPMSFLAADYAVWQLKMDMAHDLPADSIVILGDSTALADLIPDEMGPNVFNLGLGAGTSIDAFALARILVASPHPPRAVLISFDPIHFFATDGFWNHSAKYFVLNREDLEEVRARARACNDKAEWTVNTTEVKPLFGPQTAGDIEAHLKIDLYSVRFPSFYFASLLAGSIFGRESNNLKVYQEIRNAHGYEAYGLAAGSKVPSMDTLFPEFKASPLFDGYLSDTVALFQKKNIRVYYIERPLSDISATALHSGFAAAFDDHILSFEKRYPNFHRLGGPLPVLPWTDFGDHEHLNPAGAAQFSRHIAGLLHEVGVQ